MIEISSPITTHSGLRPYASIAVQQVEHNEIHDIFATLCFVGDEKVNGAPTEMIPHGNRF